MKLLIKLLFMLGVGLAFESYGHHTDTHFADQSTHQVVYQCNQSDADYLSHILFSVGELIRKYGDDVEVVVVCFGPGIHLLGDLPADHVPKELRQKAASLAQYGVAFHACKNTMNSLGWLDEDMVDFAEVVPIGADDLMLLQEQGFAYISW